MAGGNVVQRVRPGGKHCLLNIMDPNIFNIIILNSNDVKTGFVFGKNGLVGKICLESVQSKM